jgi:2-polyprenyl-3-methyl-5-hydroxy-6-metoxy-1,4-benzoquinol methylase
MSNICPVCSTTRNHIFTAKILHKYDVNYLYCYNCGLLQTEKPYWLEEAYSDAIADADTGIISRNLRISRKLACILYFIYGKEGKYLDIAGGYGLLTRMMRDIGFDFYWEDIYCKNLFAKGFDSHSTKIPAKVVSAFEVLEHIEHPIEFIDKTLKKSEASTIIFSTYLYQGEPPEPENWWYYSFETGQHISFYQLKTLKSIAKQLSLYLYSYKEMHMLTNQKLPHNFIWSFFTGKFSIFLYEYIKLKMHSKTFEDHKLMLEKAL